MKKEFYSGDFLSAIIRNQAQVIKYLDSEFENSGYYKNPIDQQYLKHKLALMTGNLFILQYNKNLSLKEVNKFLQENRAYINQLLNKSLALCLTQYQQTVGVIINENAV